MTTHKNVKVRTVNHGGRIRVIPVHGQGVDASKFVSFPTMLRNTLPVGTVFTVEHLTMPNNGSHYVAGGSINVLQAGRLGTEVASLAQAKPAARVLTPDEVITAGRDLTVRPSQTARMVYEGAMRAPHAFGRELAAAAGAHAERIAEWPAFTRETFAKLFDERGCVEVPKDEQSKWGAGAVSAMEAQPEWAALRQASQVSRSIAAEATATLSHAVASALGIDKLDAKRDPQEIEAEAGKVRAQLDALGASEEQIAEVLAPLDAELANATGARAALGQRAAGEARTRIRAAVVRVAKDASDKAEAITALRGLGFTRNGAGQDAIEEAAPDLVQSLMTDKRLLAILRWAGRFRAIADGGLANSDGRVDVVGVVPTGDISRLTSRALGMLAAPGVLGLVGLRSLVEHQAQGKHQRAQEPQGKGPAWVMVDRSGSMAGEREVRARGLALAATLTMLKRGRSVLACSFAGTDDCTSATVKPGDIEGLKAAVHALTRSAGGGTDVDHAIGWCSRAKAMRAADALVITDGAFDPLNAASLKAMGDARLLGVYLDHAGVAAHPEFDGGWDMSGPIDDATAASILNAMRKPRAKRKAVA